MTMSKDLGFDVLALSETHKWRLDTEAIFSEQPEDGDMPEHRLVRQVLLKCVKPTHETLFADVPNLSIENATTVKCLRIGSCRVAIGPHCVANLYQGELQ